MSSSIQSADAMAGNEMILAYAHQRRHDGWIVGPTQWAGHFAVVERNGMVAPARIGDRHRGEQPSRIGMLRIAEHCLARTDLDAVPVFDVGATLLVAALLTSGLCIALVWRLAIAFPFAASAL